MKSVTMRVLSILVFICMITSLFSIIYHMNNDEYKTETAVWAAADDVVSFKGVYVRNEEIIHYNKSGVVSYAVPDGAKLGKGSVIADIYADGQQIDIRQKVSEIEDKLEKINKIQNPGTSKSAQPVNLSNLIDEKYKSIINAREKGDIRDISLKTDELVILMSTYQLVVDDNMDFSKYALELQKEQDKLKAMEVMPIDSITSDKSAYFVSYADGYEKELSMDKLSEITPELIDEVTDNGISDESNVIGKLISGYEWYIAGVVDNIENHFSIDEEVRLKFRSTSESINGVVFDIRDTKTAGKSIIIVKCSDITYDFVQHRTEQVEMVKGEFEGIKIPRKAIRFKQLEVNVTDEKTGKTTKQLQNCKGVYVKLGEQINFKRLDVIYEGDNFVLSSKNAGSEFVSLYDDIVVEGIDADGK